MTTLERRALYNLLRMHWLNDPSMRIEAWQVEDYRSWSLEKIFEKLQKFSIYLEVDSFLTYSESCDSPEDLTSYLLGDRILRAQEEDQIYLLIFELWRQLLPNKPSLSIFCNDLDYLIYLHDQEDLENPLILHDAISHLLSILNDNVDAGIEPGEAFKRISAFCANDLETFLYDFILEQIENDNEAYALELLDGFGQFFPDNKWFSLLRAKLMNRSNVKYANRMMIQIAEDYLEEQDLDFNLEFLSLMAEAGSPLLFKQVIKETIPLLPLEEDFQDLLSICIDYFHRLDQDQEEQSVRKILEKRSNFQLDKTLSPKDPDLVTIYNLQ